MLNTPQYFRAIEGERNKKWLQKNINSKVLNLGTFEYLCICKSNIYENHC